MASIIDDQQLESTSESVFTEDSNNKEDLLSPLQESSTSSPKTSKQKIMKLPQQPVSMPSECRDMIRKVEVGKRPQNFEAIPHKVLMVLGATGAGKSTLVNGLVNYIMGVRWEDGFRFKLIVDEEVNQANSVTDEITAYTIYPTDGSTIHFAFTIVDTPGFGDTRGMTRDEQITMQIKNFFSLADGNGIDHIDAVGFVTQGSLARLTPTQVYIFNSIQAIFGKDVKENILMMLTFCDGSRPQVLDAINEAKIPHSGVFKFNNSVLYEDNSKGDDLEDDDSDDDDLKISQSTWSKNEKSFKNFFGKLDMLQPVSLYLTKDVLANREKLQNVLEGIQIKIADCTLRMQTLREEEKVIQEHEKDIAENKRFSYKIKVNEKKTVTLPKGKFAINCMQCRSTCAYPCDESQIIWESDTMTDGGKSEATCTTCERNCHWKEHKLTDERYELIQKEETRHYEDLKKKYYAANSRKVRCSRIIESVSAELEKEEAELHMLVQDARTCLDILKEIALKPSPMSQSQYIDMMICAERACTPLKKGWQDRIIQLEKAKKQALILEAVMESGSIKEQIEKLRMDKNEGWEEKVNDLECIFHIDTKVQERKKKKKGFFSRFSRGIKEIGQGIKTMTFVN